MPNYLTLPFQNSQSTRSIHHAPTPHPTLSQPAPSQIPQYVPLTEAALQAFWALHGDWKAGSTPLPTFSSLITIPRSIIGGARADGTIGTATEKNLQDRKGGYRFAKTKGGRIRRRRRRRVRAGGKDEDHHRASEPDGDINTQDKHQDEEPFAAQFQEVEEHIAFLQLVENSAWRNRIGFDKVLRGGEGS